MQILLLITQNQLRLKNPAFLTLRAQIIHKIIPNRIRIINIISKDDNINNKIRHESLLPLLLILVNQLLPLIQIQLLGQHHKHIAVTQQARALGEDNNPRIIQKINIHASTPEPLPNKLRPERSGHKELRPAALPFLDEGYQLSVVPGVDVALELLELLV